MSDISKALQGKMNTRKGHVKEQSERQLDLFSSLADRETSSPKVVPASKPEPEMILPPSAPPPDVAADVRAVLSESGPARSVETAPAGEEVRPLKTGIYRRPSRPAAIPLPPRSAPPPASRIMPVRWLQNWLAGVELNRRMIALVVVVAILVALVGFWSACPRHAQPQAGPPVNLAEEAPSAPQSPAAPVPPPPTPVAPAAPKTAPVAVPVQPAAPADDWKIAGTTATRKGNAIQIVFAAPVFVSADNISIEGMNALKALAARLVALKTSARVLVIGYTDDVPLSAPTAKFKSNADLAAARAQVAVEHLAQLARANKGVVFEAVAGEPTQAPYPNDSPQNRRLNRTVTLQVVPAP